MDEKLVKELIEIGLAEKEARVYLASLELGPDTAQNIAVKAQISRPNTYIAIEALTKRGLMSSFKKGKKNYLSAQQPDQLRVLIDEFRDSINKKENLLRTVLADISTFRLQSKAISDIEIFEDLAGLVVVQDDIINNAKDELLSLAAIDEARRYVTSKSIEPIWCKLAKKSIRVKSLYTGSDVVDHSDDPNWESRRLDRDKYAFRGEFVIYGRNVALVSYQKRIQCIIIRNEVISETFRVLFNLAWENAIEQSNVCQKESKKS